MVEEQKSRINLHVMTAILFAIAVGVFSGQIGYDRGFKLGVAHEFAAVKDTALPTISLELSQNGHVFTIKTVGCLDGNKEWKPRHDGFCYLADEPK